MNRAAERRCIAASSRAISTARELLTDVQRRGTQPHGAGVAFHRGVRHLTAAPNGSLRHHLIAGDFSRWGQRSAIRWRTSKTSTSANREKAEPRAAIDARRA